MNRAQLIRKLEGDRYTRKSFDELVKAAGDRTKLVSALLTVVEAWGQKVPLFPWKDAARGISSFCERLESVAKEIEEVSQYPFIAVAGFKVARHRRAKRVAFSGPVSDPMVVKRREEQFWKGAQEYPQELRQLARLLRWHGRLVKLSYEETRRDYPRGFDLGNQALVRLCDIVKGSKRERHWATLADVMGVLNVSSMDSNYLQKLHKRNTLSSRIESVRRRAEKPRDERRFKPDLFRDSITKS